MAGRIEDYGLIGDLHTAALVRLDGSIDWLCVPRFDSPACFAALLGDEDNGFWRISPHGLKRASRRYLGNSLVLETRFETDEGVVSLVDFMPVRQDAERTSVARIVRGESGHVKMQLELVIRFDYGLTVPWVRRRDFGLSALSGPNLLEFRSPVPIENEDFRTQAEFTVGPGDEVPFLLTYREVLQRPAEPLDAQEQCRRTQEWWEDWARRCRYHGRYEEAVIRSLITLKALTHRPTGGVIAAPTTSLPETIGGERNWDYRFCWLRDATFTLYALLSSGLEDEAKRWREWLLRVGAGKPSQLQSLYGSQGERLLPEVELSWLSGYEGSRPVRIGNAAHQQLQLDIYGELMDVFHVSRRHHVGETDDSWGLQRQLMDFLESGWREPDNGIWEVRGPRRHFTHSKVMTWVALDRAIKAVERFAWDGPLERWRRLRQEIHDEVCARAFDADRKTFVQYYGAKSTDAALLMMPLVGFLPADDQRVQGTARTVEAELMHDGFVFRYAPDTEIEGVQGREGAFLACTFWLADNYAMRGDLQAATRIFERVLAIRNDLGLLSEEYDPVRKRLLGNFPQAFSHVSLVNAAHNLSDASPAAHRSEKEAHPP